MRITVLGKWSPYPKGNEACSGYLIENSDTRIALDFGNGVFSKLELYGSFWDLNAIICTHLHADHSGDLPIARNAVKSGILYNKIKAKMPVYLPGEPALNYSIIDTYQDGLQFNIIEGLPEENLYRTTQIGSLKLKFFKVEHTMLAYGVEIETQGKRVAYTGDTHYFPDLIDYVMAADLFICEATVLEKNKDYAVGRHLTARQAGEIARRAKVKQFLPSHFFPEYDLDYVKKEIEEGYGSGIIMAEEGMIIEI
ncbi:MAG: MBL fold metallo-hydrolase [Clostridia bacterium]|nr:MBL fold metallo-hydrolase [Clostridia bacterium]